VAPGVSLAVRDRRPDEPSATTGVLVHGLASTSRLWDGVAQRLSALGHRAVAVDLRGHGESDAPDGGYDTGTAADDVVALLESLGGQPVLLAGQSWGGNVVLQVAARRPDLVAGLALVDGGWIDLARRFESWEAALEVLTPPTIDGMDAERFRAMVGASLGGFPEGAVDAATSVVRELPGSTIERRLTVPRHLEILRSMWADTPSRWYPLVTAPTVLMPATIGDTLPDEVADAVASIPRATVRPYPGAHHDIHLQRPDEVAADIRSLL
jgi:pimeloyl-ACP methyl ester carboxylesterase